MKKLLAVVITIVLSFFPLYAYAWKGLGWKAQIDATDVAPDTLNFDNNLSSSDSTVQAALETLDELSSGGTTDDDITVNSSAVDTTANFLDNTDITWTLTDGGVGGPDDITGTVVDDSHNHVYSNIDVFTEANLYSILSDVTQFYEVGDDISADETDPNVDTSAEVIAIINAGVATDLEHEVGGLEADVSAYTGLLAISGGTTSEVDAKSELEAQIADVADFAEADGDTHTGVHDFGGATSVEIPNGTGPTTDAAGEVAIDTNASAYGALEMYGATASTLTPGLKVAHATIWDPDGLQSTEDAIPIMRVETEWAPNGITIVDIFMSADASNSASINWEEWTSPTDASPTTIETCAFSASTEFEDDGTLSNANVAAGSYVFIDLDTTALNFLQVTFTYIIKGD